MVLHRSFVFALFFVVQIILSSALQAQDSKVFSEDSMRFHLDQMEDFFRNDPNKAKESLAFVSSNITPNHSPELLCKYYGSAWLINYYHNKLSYDSLPNYIFPARKYCHSCKDTIGEINANFQLSNYYYLKQDFEKSYQFGSEVLHLATAKSDTFRISLGHLILGTLNEAIKNNNSAISNFEKAIFFAEKSQNGQQNFDTYISLAALYSETGAFDKAIKTCIKGIQLFEENDALNTVPFVPNKYILQSILMQAYIHIEKNDAAKPLANALIEVLPSVKEAGRIKFIKRSLGAYYMAIGQNELAKKQYLEALALSNPTAISENKALIYKPLAQIAEREGDTELAAQYYAKAIHIQDSIQKKTAQDAIRISDWETKYENQQHHHKIDVLTAEQKTSVKTISSQNKNIIFLIVFSLLLLALSLCFYFKKRNIAKAKAALWRQKLSLEKHQTSLRQKNKMLEQEIEEARKQLIHSSKEWKNEKYNSSSLSEDQKKQTKDLLINMIQDQKAFLDPLITLDILASQLEINRSYLSQIINEHFKMNFNQLINYYRVMEACDLFSKEENQKYTIEHIARKAGFKSISPFNLAFKKHTGNTPSDFRKKALCKEKA